MKEVKITCKTTYSDYLQMNLYHGRKNRIMLLAFYLVIYLGVIVYQTGSILSITQPLVLTVGVILLGLLYALTRISLWWRSKRIFTSDKLLHQDQLYRFSTDGIYYTTTSGTGNIGWSDIYKVVETPKYFYIYVGKLRSLVIPKASMTSPSDITDLRELIVSRVDSKIRRLRTSI